MAPENKLTEQVKTLMWAKGRKSLEKAKKVMLQEKIDFEPLQAAIRYFMEEFWVDVLHPAMISIACEMVGGKPDATTDVGAAVVLLAGGADVHDDVIDESSIKDTKPTVFGKFGKDIAVLVGDALLFKGICALNDACASLPENQRRQVMELVKQGFFRIGNAEAQEASLRGRYDLSAEEYLGIIETKVSIAEAAMKIGSIIGGGTSEETETLGHFGKTLGLLLTIRDEFVDVFEQDELKNRFQKECLPLPVLAAMQDSSKKDMLLKLLSVEDISEREVDQVLKIVMRSKGAQQLRKKMRLLVEEESRLLSFEKQYKSQATLLLRSTLEDL